MFDTPNLATVLVGKRKAEIFELNDPVLSPNQVRVAVHYSALCGTQLGEWDQSRGPDPYLPHCLGHEAVGTVIETGEVVSQVSIGDTVVVSWIRNPGDANSVPPTFFKCTTGNKTKGERVNFGNCCTFIRRAVVAESNVTKICVSKILPAHSLLGCAFLTAYATLNAVRSVSLSKSETVPIWGLGGIGLCTAFLLAAEGYSVIGVDPYSNLEDDDSHALGLRQVVQSMPSESYGLFRVAIVTAGSRAAIDSAQKSLLPNGGVLFISGNLPYGQTASIDIKPLLYGRQIIGVGERLVVPSRDIPEIIELLDRDPSVYERLVSGVYPITQTNSVMSDLLATGGRRRVFSIKD
jgi:S-(hydroxymethyl)glutathione dehydrogenase/alcohol dehydrogenase